MTISIFRAKKNRELFRRLEKAGQLVKGNAQGIYYVKGLTDLPFQIVITGELAGAEYAAYRALTEGADKTDVEQIIEDVEKETDSVIRRHYQILLSQISRKNIETMESIRGENEMEDALMELLRDRIDREIDEKVREREQQVKEQVKQEEKLIAIKNVMKSLRISEEKAMDVLDIPQSQRETYMGLLIREK